MKGDEKELDDANEENVEDLAESFLGALMKGSANIRKEIGV